MKCEVALYSALDLRPQLWHAVSRTLSEVQASTPLSAQLEHCVTNLQKCC